MSARPKSAAVEARAGETVLAHLARAVPGASKNRLRQLLQHGCVQLNGQPTSRGSTLLKEGDEVCIVSGRPDQRGSLAGSGLRVVYEDRTLIVVDKPAGLLSIGTATERAKTAHALLCRYVQERTRQASDRVFVVHRLDQGTSGLLLFAKQEEIKLQLQRNWMHTRKTYLAVVEGCPKPAEATLRTYLRETSAGTVYPTTAQAGRMAITHYRTIRTCQSRTLLEVDLQTGRKHQIRVQLSEVGHPVLGDRLYGSQTHLRGRFALHAHLLAFQHPVTGQVLTCESPLPSVLEALV